MWRKRRSNCSRKSSGHLASASSREKVCFFVRKWVVPSAEIWVSEKVGCSRSWSNESTGESSQVPCLVSKCKPSSLAVFPVFSFFPHNKYLPIISNSSSLGGFYTNISLSKYLCKKFVLSSRVLREKSSRSRVQAISTLYVSVHL